MPAWETPRPRPFRAKPEEASRLRGYIESGRAKQLREQAGLTLLEIANMVEGAENTVSRWERGLVQPRGRFVAAYLSVLQKIESDLKEGSV